MSLGWAWNVAHLVTFDGRLVVAVIVCLFLSKDVRRSALKLIVIELCKTLVPTNRACVLSRYDRNPYTECTRQNGPTS